MEIKEEEPAKSGLSLKDMAPAQSDASAPTPPTTGAPFVKPCAILLDGLDGPILGGKGLGVSDIETRILFMRRADADPWMGFSFELPLGQANEEEGFGMCYKINLHTRRLQPADTRRIMIKFPRDGFQHFIEPVSDALRARFPSIKEAMSLVHVSLKDAALIQVHGFGIPFRNNGHPSEDWLRGQVIAGSRTLFDVLQSDSFIFVVLGSSPLVEKRWNADMLPMPFSFPYGTTHRWDKETYEKMLAENKGHQFLESWSYPDDNAHLSALTQSQVQDVMWLDQAAAEIRKLRFSTYFVESQPGTKYFAIVVTPKSFREKFASAMRVLLRNGTFQLRLFDSLEDDKAAAVGKWDARIVDNPKVDALKGHTTVESDTTLLVRRPLSEEASRGPGFTNCAALDMNVQLADYERKVNAVCNFHPDVEPTNFVGHMSEEVKLRMTLHRDLLRGTGFYDTLIRGTTADRHLSWDNTPVPMPRTLPVASLLNTDQNRTEALMEEALPNDRARFQNYLSERPLGLGIITAGAGFGKTTALAVGTLGMACTLGKIYATAPTHVAVENFADRLDRVDTSVTDRLNRGRDDGTTRARYKHIVRGYKVNNEADAFLHLLRVPDAGDQAAPNLGWTSQPLWKKHLSAAFWLLVVLRSPETRGLRTDDSLGLYGLRGRIDNDEDLQRLRAVVSHEIDYSEYERGTMVDKIKLMGLLDEVINAADIVCTTPALSTKEPYALWKYTAKGIAVDEAGCINRPDLYCIWGNTLLPCLMAGDDRQLPPTVVSLQQQDSEGHYVNRLGNHGKISPLLFLRAMGWPVYRLHTQLRMAKGMFDLCHAEIYGDLPLQYGLDSDISLPQHAVGRLLEQYLQQKYPELTPATPGTLQPVLFHCKGSYCHINPVTMSRSNTRQNKVALTFLSNFVKSSGVDPASVTIISPYQANVDVLNRMRKKPAHALIASMQDAITIDSFQGQECDIVVIVLGTTSESGPGFTADEQRLNVMFTRQRSGLLIFGDIGAAGPLNEKKRKKSTDASGKVSYSRATVLRSMYRAMDSGGRVIHVEAGAKTEA